MWRPKLMSIPTADQALPGRAEPLYQVPQRHHVNGNLIAGERPAGLSEVLFGMGCFWGAERKFWSLPGVYSTAVGYGAGHTQHPTYEEVCSGMTGHNELVRVWFDEQQLPLEQLLAVFWESHDPTQGMRQGNDIGTQYRSGIYLSQAADLARAEASREHYQQRLYAFGMGDITSEILIDVPFYLAEGYHQQYLAKNPNGYCGLGGCNVSFD
ncbi:peptide-methionine (S)-S-oxide reductase MsrA [Thalassolituus hydrocarboniclasticus]|jgi:peptide-methionine (S)-S-oxide reductase|uniref:Peptide methionine sulfoxide reductase MsrA n=1 Tax=Thalassolituus hydrocarboniclasticus TaxID=2742796 RepID=A0ABY6ABV4_9GAMM|nr:peptide-methionine (S)-S-oxide reductase MsrA [Thalassolituus hydrocarboniclasticus]UXD88070.1 peptide-methionine (S)-S-oxide reductase MsrA [Thalassolituus hydrocarboniclasticus]